MVNPLYSITPFTLLDYPDYPACILWFAGCNMRCLYCYNPQIVLGKGKVSIEEAEHFLQSRKSLLQGVVFSGGECTLHPDLFQLARLAKRMGYKVKVDTNGTRPDVLRRMREEHLLDYVALDFKGMGNKHRYITVSDTFYTFEKSLNLLQQMEVPFEIRTTWHPDLLSIADITAMINFLKQHRYQGKYFIQHFMNGVKTLSPLSDRRCQIDPKPLSTVGIQVEIRNM